MASRFSKVDEYGFQRPDNFDYSSYEQFMEGYLGVLSRRAQKWEGLLAGKKEIRRGTRTKRYVRKGIPAKLRGQVWMELSGARQLKEQNPELYRKRLNGPLRADVVDSISVDVPRTFPDNIHFTDTEDGQLHRLHNVLVAYAHDNTTIGYCQGLNYIAALLLVVTRSEEDSFWLLKAMTERILTPEYYSEELIGVKTDFGTLGELVQWKCPEVHAKVEETGATWALLVAKWFMCCYADVLPTETCLRVWDCLFYEGVKVLFRVALTLVMANREKVAACRDLPDIITVFKQMMQDPFVVASHDFLKGVFTIPGSFPMARIRKMQDKCREEILLEDQNASQNKKQS